MKREQTAINRKQTIIFTAESQSTQSTEKQIRLTTEDTEKRKEKILELKNNRQRRVLKKRAQRKTYQKLTYKPTNSPLKHKGTKLHKTQGKEKLTVI